MLHELFALFADVSWIVSLLLCLGIILCFIEAVIPGFGIFGILGFVFEVTGVIVHGFISKSAPQVVGLVVMLIILTVLIFLIFTHSAKKGLLSHSPFVQTKTAVPVNNNIKEIEQLIGKEGIVIFECKPVGKAEIDNKMYEVLSSDEILKKGTKVVVFKISGDSIYIKSKENKGVKK